jgi:S-adenosylmethionine decarboxylase
MCPVSPIGGPLMDVSQLPRLAGTAANDSLSLMALHGRMVEMDRRGNDETGFEGPEKRLELDVRFQEGRKPNALGARAIPVETWHEVMDLLKAKIVDTIKNEHQTAHLLTESSLFVSTGRITLITCGTTVLLNALGRILAAIHAVGMDVEWFSYSRKNYTFPWVQKPPHSSISEEYAVLKTHFKFGQPFIFGPVDGDHYFYFLWDDIIRVEKDEVDMNLNVVMYDMEDSVAQQFFSSEFSFNSERTSALRKSTGIDGLVAEWRVQDMLFSPCGYSINGIDGPTYYTMHITPESHCSYASFETNLASVDNYQPLVSKVLTVFKPRRFTVLMLMDYNSIGGTSYRNRNPVGVEVDSYPDYVRFNHTMNEFGPGYFTFKVNYVLRSEVVKHQSAANPPITLPPTA